MSKRVNLLSDQEVQANLEGIEPQEARWVLEDYLSGEMSPTITLSRLVLSVGDVCEVEALVDAVERAWEPPVPESVPRLIKMLRENRRGLERVAANLVEHPDPETPYASAEEGIETARRFFDRVVRRSEEASVAAHSLGDPKLLKKATREVVDVLASWGVLGAESRTLEIGCGIGRFQAALAPQVATAHGIDISPRMIEAARRRCAGLPNAFLAVCSGRDLAGFADASLDFVFAVDSFPYIHHAGPELVDTHFREAIRVLAAGGELALLNVSYRDDIAADRRDFERLCRTWGFEPLAAAPTAQRPFRMWDGVAFRARKRAILRSG
jgi:ubiquinone/menaquinone biosynthesis C-methylase UbiE